MDEHARRLSSAIDGLAGALRHAGAPEAESARLLELAAIASLQALVLREEVRPALPLPAREPAHEHQPVVTAAAPLRPVSPLSVPRTAVRSAA
jgi:hypothetical protein